MKQLLLILLLLLPLSFLFAQSKIEIGAGLSYETHYLDHTTDYSYTGYQTSPANLLGVNTYLHLNTDKKFQFRINAHFGKKDMVFSQSTFLSSGGLQRESIHHHFLSADLSLLALYAIKTKNDNLIQPILGFFTSYSHFSHASWRLSLSGVGGGQSNTTNSNLWVPDISNEPSVFYVGVNTGLIYRLFIRNFPIEVMGLFYLSPANMFEFQFEYLGGLESADFKGRYHHFTLGFNIPILK